MFYYLFIKNHGVDSFGYHNGLEAVIINEEKLTGEKRIQLENDGFKLIHDSLKTKEDAEIYAAREYNAHVRKCKGCGKYHTTNLVRGRKINSDEKYTIFNAWVCDLCADGVEGKIVKSGYYVNNDNIHFPERFTDMAIADFPELKN